MSYRRVAQLKSADQFQEYCRSIGADLPIEPGSADDAPLAQPISYRQRTIGNRFTILPMEGWDGTKDGRPTDLVRRRWENFGRSGAKLIWGGEAVAVRHDGRANPNQLVISDQTVSEIEGLRQLLVATHEREVGPADDLYVGLQLTHSGRFCRPNDHHRLEPRVAYRHPCLDERFGVSGDDAVLTDDEIRSLIDDFIVAGRRAQQAGFHFVDLKHCHGYLGHEFLSGIDRPGPFGGSLENRTRFLQEIVAGIRAEAPGLDIGVRLSVFDFVPFAKGPDQTGRPAEIGEDYPYAFGGDGTGTGIDLTETFELIDMLQEIDIQLLCVSAGSPYYVPHIQRPALFPPSDGYLPPEDPLVGVARQIQATARIKAYAPDMVVVGSAYSYLQEWLAPVATAVVRRQMADSVGIGRLVLSYPRFPADVLAGADLDRKKFCRTFSDCTSGPRQGFVSGCYPLDPFYKDRPEAVTLAELRKSMHRES